jgi:hypothetical protein
MEPIRLRKLWMLGNQFRLAAEGMQVTNSMSHATKSACHTVSGTAFDFEK